MAMTPSRANPISRSAHCDQFNLIELSVAKCLTLWPLAFEFASSTRPLLGIQQDLPSCQPSDLINRVKANALRAQLLVFLSSG